MTKVLGKGFFPNVFILKNKLGSKPSVFLLLFGHWMPSLADLPPSYSYLFLLAILKEICY
jgi:hypothetical protein